MVGGAVEAEVDGQGDRRPCWVLGAAVEADLCARWLSITCRAVSSLFRGDYDMGEERVTCLVCGFGVELVEDVLGLGFAC